MKVDSEMDQTYVYIRLTDGDATKFIMLPRIFPDRSVAE